MGVFTYEDRQTSALPPAKLYNALAKNSETIFPKVIPSIKSVEVVEGNGGPGSVIKITSDEGYGLNKVEEVDEANWGYKYSIVGGNILPDTVEKISFHDKLEEGPNGGTIANIKVTYYTKGDAPPSDEELKSGKDKGTHIFKAVDAYLTAHPHAFNV